MACFLKLPTNIGKGVITFTDYEWTSQISKSPLLYKSLSSVKPHWFIGLHHNSPHAKINFEPDPLFDFHLAGPGDLSTQKSSSFHQIELDCSNFCPSFFEYNRKYDSIKFWDVLFISRNVFFKSLDNLFKIVRLQFDHKPLRILAIVPHEGLHLKGVGPSKAIQAYLEMFSDEERKMFTLMTPSLDTPFPFDLPTLAHFYHHSRTFLHVAEAERHPRVVAYAWAAGLPVIAPPQVASLLPHSLQATPGFYSYKNIEQAPNLIESALRSPFPADARSKYVQHHLAETMTETLKSEIASLYRKHKSDFSDDNWLLSNLDIRLARHHLKERSRNSLGTTIAELISVLNEPFKFPAIQKTVDFEVFLSNHMSLDPNFDKSVSREIKLREFKQSISIGQLRSRILWPFFGRFPRVKSFVDYWRARN